MTLTPGLNSLKIVTPVPPYLRGNNLKFLVWMHLNEIVAYYFWATVTLTSQLSCIKMCMEHIFYIIGHKPLRFVDTSTCISRGPLTVFGSL